MQTRTGDRMHAHTCTADNGGGEGGLLARLYDCVLLNGGMDDITIKNQTLFCCAQTGVCGSPERVRLMMRTIRAATDQMEVQIQQVSGWCFWL